MVNPEGYGAPFFNVYTSKGVISTEAKRLEFKYSEEDDDEIKITIHTSDPGIADLPEFQHDVELRVVWGWIKGKTSPVRKVYIRNTNLRCNDKGATLTITATDKASYLKNQKAKDTQKDTDFGKVAKKAAEENGLDLQVLKTVKYGGSHPRVTRDIGKGPRSEPSNRSADEISSETMMNKQDIGALDNARVQGSRTFLARAEIIQANKNKMQHLRDEAEKEPGNPKVFGREDKLNVRDRDFSQPPVKEYTYEEHKGEYLDFEVTFEEKKKNSDSIDIKVGGWLASAKKFVEEHIGEVDEDKPNLGDSVPASAFRNKSTRNTKNSDEGKSKTSYKEKTWEGDNKRTKDLSSNTRYSPNPDSLSKKPQFVGDRNNLVDLRTSSNRIYKNEEAEEDQYRVEMKGTPYLNNYGFEASPGISEYNDATSAVDNTAVMRRPKADMPFSDYVETAEDVKKDQAGNMREESADKRIEADFKAVGDPVIEDGVVISILESSKKFSGNYYVTTVNHVIEPGRGYIMEYHLIKDATGKLPEESPKNIDSSESGKEVNKKEVDSTRSNVYDKNLDEKSSEEPTRIEKEEFGREFFNE